MLRNNAGRPRTKPAEQRRADLIRSAEQLFLEKGVEPTTIEEITAAAAVSKGAFYLHFSSKADVIKAMRRHFVEGLLDRVRDAVGRQRSDDWNGKLTAWASACATAYLDATPLHRLVFASAPAPDRQGLTRNILIDDLADLLADGCRAAAWSLDDPAFTAIFLFNALHAVVDQDDLADNDEKRRALLAHIEVHVHRLVG